MTLDPADNPKSAAPSAAGKHWLEFAVAALLALTLLATGTAAYYTRRQSIIATDVEKRQLRAYLGVYVSDEDANSIDLRPPSIPVFRAHFRNAGQTPAREVVYRARVYILVSPPSEDYIQNSLHTNSEPSPPRTVLPNNGPDEIEVYKRKKYPMTNEEYGSLFETKNASAAVYFFGSIEYKDAFDEEHDTDFCYGFSLRRDLEKEVLHYELCAVHNGST